MALEYRMCRLECGCGLVSYQLLETDPTDPKPSTQDTFDVDLGGFDTVEELLADIQKVSEAAYKAVTVVKCARCYHR